MTDLLVATLAVVVVYNLLKLAESKRLGGAAGTLNTILNHVLDPARPLVPWPPGHGG